MAQPLDRITHSPDILAGRATVRGLRVSVAHIVNLVASGMTPGEIIADLHRAADRGIIEHDQADDRIVLTFDLDFGDILALGVMDKPSVILFRQSTQFAHGRPSYRKPPEGFAYAKGEGVSPIPEGDSYR